jgi:porin
MGLKPGYMSAYTIVTVGADLDMQKIVGYRSATIHFQQELLPFGHNLSYGNQTGDSIVGTNIYAPKTSYLGQFTWEQKAFDNRLELEGGKANAFTHFAFPNCIQLIICQSPILQRDAGINPPTLFSNWFARAAYKVGVELIASEFSGAGIQ